MTTSEPTRSAHPPKGTVADLALAGAPPAFDRPLHVGAPNIGDRAAFHRRMDEVFDDAWLSNDGRLVREMEAACADRLGVPHVVAVANATLGLSLAATALGLVGRVLVPAFTFVATAHAFRWLGLQPVFCDIDPVTHLVDPDDVARKLTTDVSAVVGVHLWGQVAPVDELTDLARGAGAALLFDAAHAFGASDRAGRRVGSFGACEVFSLHATKTLNSFEGGIVTTTDDALARRLRLLRNFGFAGLDSVVALGVNAKMHEASAAMGLTNLASFDEFAAAHRRHHEHYRRRLDGLPGLRLLALPAGAWSSGQYVVAEVDEGRAGISRDDALTVLRAENVLARRYFHPGVHRMEPYASDPAYAGVDVPVTEEVCRRVLVLPNGAGLTDGDVDLVCDVVSAVWADPGGARALVAAAGVPTT